MINRAQLRGKPLDRNCKKARTEPHQYGQNDDRVFCSGLINYENDEFLPKCRDCGAFVDNAMPPENESR